MKKPFVTISGVIGATALFSVMALVFVAVILRYFGIVVADAYDLSRMLLGILIFWGIALAVAENSMIKVDALYLQAGPKARLAIRTFAAIVTAVALSLVAWRAGVAVLDAWNSKVSTSDLRIRLWPFYAAASAALIPAVALAFIRLFGNEHEEDS